MAGKSKYRAAWRIVGVALLVLTVVSLSTTVTRAQQPEPALLEELAERLLLPTFSPPGASPPRVELLPGTLPPALPLTVPMLPGSRLIGSAVRTNVGPPGTQTDVILDVPGQATAVFKQLQSDIQEMGWTAPPFGPAPELSGFQPVMQPLVASLCRSNQGPWLQMTVLAREMAPNDVRLSIYSSSGPCGAQPGPTSSGPPGQNLVPLIATPEGVTLTRSSSLIGGGSWASFAVADSAHEVAVIETAIAGQLATAGWVRIDGAAVPPFAWSTWSVPGEGDWRGLLTVLEGPGPGQRWLLIQVAAPTVPDTGDGPTGP